MTGADELADALAGFGVTAVAEGDAVRAWIAGTGRAWVLISAATSGGRPVWSWRHAGETGWHPRGDSPGAAAAVTRFVSGNSP